jgi:hypothetical protein
MTGSWIFAGEVDAAPIEPGQIQVTRAGQANSVADKIRISFTQANGRPSNVPFAALAPYPEVGLVLYTGLEPPLSGAALQVASVTEDADSWLFDGQGPGILFTSQIGDKVDVLLLPMNGGTSIYDMYDVEQVQQSRAGQILTLVDVGGGVFKYGNLDPPAGGGGGASSLDELSDVDTSTIPPGDRATLVWSNGEWVPDNAAKYEHPFNYTGAIAAVPAAGECNSSGTNRYRISQVDSLGENCAAALLKMTVNIDVYATTPTLTDHHGIVTYNTKGGTTHHDVYITWDAGWVEPTAGQSITFEWPNLPDKPVVMLDGLDDATVTNSRAGDILRYMSSNGDFTNGPWYPPNQFAYSRYTWGAASDNFYLNVLPAFGSTATHLLLGKQDSDGKAIDGRFTTAVGDRFYLTFVDRQWQVYEVTGARIDGATNGHGANTWSYPVRFVAGTATVSFSVGNYIQLTVDAEPYRVAGTTGLSALITEVQTLKALVTEITRRLEP